MIQFKPIGIVRNAIQQAHRNTPWQQIESEIVVNHEWHDALDGLEQFSHIWIIFHIHQIAPPDSMCIRPMQRDDMPLVGRFATRSPSRPNLLGTCAVELIEKHDGILHLRGLDALDGTPVLDIKPYLARDAAIANTRVGEWVRRYWAET